MSSEKTIDPPNNLEPKWNLECSNDNVQTPNQIQFTEKQPEQRSQKIQNGNNKSEDHKHNQEGSVILLRKALFQLIGKQPFEIKHPDCQDAVDLILKNQIQKLGDHLNADEMNLLESELNKMAELQSHWNRSNSSQKQQSSYISGVASKMIQELKVKDKYRQDCLNLLISKDIGQLRKLLNGKQQQHLKAMFQKYPQFLGDQSRAEQPVQILKLYIGSNNQHKDGIVQKFEKLIDLLICQDSASAELRGWDQLTFGQKLQQFQSFKDYQPPSLQKQQQITLMPLITLCRFPFYINLSNEITSQLSSEKVKTTPALKTELETLSKEIKEKIYQITSEKDFKQRYWKYKSRGKKDDLDKVVISKSSIQEYTTQKRQYIYTRTHRLYQQNEIKQYKLIYNAKIHSVQLKICDLEEKIEKITNSQFNKLILFGKHHQNTVNYYELCEIGNLQLADELKIFDALPTWISFKGAKFKIDTSEHLNKEELLQVIIKQLETRQSVRYKEWSIRLKLVFQDKNVRQLGSNEKIFELTEKFGNISLIQVQLLSHITLFYVGNQHSFEHWQNDPILILKQKIRQQLVIPVQSQILQLEIHQKLIKMQSEQTLQQKKIFDLEIDMSLFVKGNLEFYGFHENIKLIYEKFKQFFIEKQDSRTSFFSNCTLLGDKQENFFNSMIHYIFSALKKRLDLRSIINLFRKQISECKKQQIWTSLKGISTFNPTFLLYYILYNSESKLRIQVMNLVKHDMPLPLYLRSFSSITNIQNSWEINQEIFWILSNQPNIVSIGFHSEKNFEEKGKSELLNQIFYTKFVKSQSRHGITQFCPEVANRIYGSIHPANLIDIPGNTKQQIADKILKSASFIILQSWRPWKETQQEVQRIKQLCGCNVYVLTILRDLSIDHNDNWLSQRIAQDKIKLYNLTAKIDQSSIDLLLKDIKKQVHLKIKQKLFGNQPKITPASVLSATNKVVVEFESLVNNVINCPNGMRTVTKKSNQEKIQFQKQGNLQHKLRQQANLALNSQLEKLLVYISRNMENCELLMLRLKEKLKESRQSIQRRYNILIHAKQDMDTMTGEEPKYKQQVPKYLAQINRLPDIKKKFAINPLEPRSEILNGLKQAITEYENNIKPQIFSIELLWRELYALIEINNQHSLGGQHPLSDFIIEVQRRQIFCGQPFELLDGDSLRMPKTILKKIFAPIKGRAAIITTLGPQNSGKSTLFNHLFGCDFRSSEGRCTRGVYGTYYCTSQSSACGCQSFIILDTEGLLAIRNKKDEEVRKDFDSKLILFCLSVSDIVIVNTNSDLDSETMGKLQACKLKLPNFVQNSNPEFWLVMNKSQTSDITKKINDINRLSDLFDLGNSMCLCQAFDTTDLTKQQIPILGREIITKKEVKSNFLNQILKLRSDIIKKIEMKTYRCIPEIMDRMELAWSTISKFPDLVRNESKEVNQIELEINQWKETSIEELASKGKQLLKKVYNNQIKQQDAIEEFQNLRKKLKKDFEDMFNQNQNSKQVKQRIALKQKAVAQSFEYILKDFTFGIQQFQIQKVNKIQQQEGRGQLRRQIKKIKSIQAQQKEQMSEKDRRDRFQSVYTAIIEKRKKSLDKQAHMLDFFKRVKQLYQLQIKQGSAKVTSGLSKVGLPSFQKQPQLAYSYQEHKGLLLEQFQEQSMNMVISYSNRPHTNVLAGGKSSSLGGYFNMAQYFELQKELHSIQIPYASLYKSIRKDLLLQNIGHRYHQQFSEVAGKLVTQISQSINKNLRQYGWKYKELNQLSELIINYIDRRHLYPKVQSFFEEWFKLKGCPQLMPSNVQERLFGHNSDYVNIFKLHSLINELNSRRIKRNLANSCLVIRNLSQRIIKHTIKWEAIRSKISNYEAIVQLKENLKRQYSQKICKQFLMLNVSCDCDAYIEKLLESPGHLIQGNISGMIKFQPKQNHESLQPYERIEQLYQIAKGCVYLNRQPIMTETIVNKTLSKDKITIGQVYVQTYKQKEHKYKLQSYLEQSNQALVKYLKTQGIRQFLWEELKAPDKQKGLNKFEWLFLKFDQIIEKACLKYTEQSRIIENIFTEASDQIAKFNEDINQVSQKLSIKFEGFCHMYIIYMIWKYQSNGQEKRYLKPIQDLNNRNVDEQQWFIDETSNKPEQVAEAELHLFMAAFKEIYQNKVKEHKRVVMQNQKREFSKKNTREEIQYLIDIQIFDSNAGDSSKKMIEYIEDPSKVIGQKYSQLMENSVESIKCKNQQNFQHLTTILTQLQQTFESILLQLSKHAYDQTQGGISTFLRITKGQHYVNLISGNNDEEIAHLFMKFFLHLIADSRKDEQKYGQFVAVNKGKTLCWKPQEPLSEEIKDYFQKIQQKNLSLTNIIIFLKRFRNKIPSLQKQLAQIANFSQQQIRVFKEQIQVQVCPRKCPCCDRICGKPRNHQQLHQCLFGHQIRAFGGISLNNTNASAVRCERMTDTSQLKYDGHIKTWKEFKTQQLAQGWSFGDLDRKDAHIQQKRDTRYALAWRSVGEYFCRKYNMAFVDYNQSSMQNTHFIFALDESGSMKGDRWDQVMRRIEQITIILGNLPSSQELIRVSIILTDSSCRVHQTNVSPRNINLNIKPLFGGTNFSPTFQKAYQIIGEYLPTTATVFVLLTDGEASFPEQQIRKIKTLKGRSEKRLMYYGIEYESNSKIMKQIAQQLDGKNTMASNPKQLFSAFENTIEIVRKK